MHYIALFLGLSIFTVTALAATKPEHATSPLTDRDDLIEKKHQTNTLPFKLEYGGRLLLRAGDAMPLDGPTDTLRVGALELFGEIKGEGWMLHGLVLYEQQLTDPPEIDELFLHLQHKALQLQLGRQYVPFGNYDTAMVNKPLTQYMGETRAEAVTVTYETNTQYFALFAWPHERLETTVWGANGGVQLDKLELNVSYLSHLNASNGFDGVLDATDTPAGAGMHVQWATDTLTLRGEWIGAVNTFKVSQLAWQSHGAQPQSLVLESRWQFMPLWQWAVGYQSTMESVNLGLPEQRWITALNYQARKNLQVSVELSQDEDYSTKNGGTGRTDKLITAQIAFDF